MTTTPKLPEPRAGSSIHGPLYTADQLKDYAAEWCKVAVANYEAIHDPTPVPDEAVRRLVEAGKALSFAAQITGGTAGRDDGLVAAIDCFSAALAHPALRAFIGSEK
jgi:hypothetical protein